MKKFSKGDLIFLFLIFAFLLWCICGCQSSKKTQHSESTENHSAFIDSSKTTVKASTDTATKITHVTKDGTSVKITNPVFKNDDNRLPIDLGIFSTIEPHKDSAIQPAANVWSQLFNSLASADNIEINQATSDSLHKEENSSAKYDLTNQQGKAATADNKAAVNDSSKKSSGLSPWLLLWLIPIGIGVAFWKRGWIIEKFFT